MYTDGGIVSAVYGVPSITPSNDGDTILITSHSCHGGAIFPGIIDPSTGKSVISGRKVTGFTTRGEEEEGVLDTIKSWKRPTIEASAADSGATCKSPSLKYSTCLIFSRCLSRWTLGCFHHHGRTYCHRCEPCQCSCYC